MRRSLAPFVRLALLPALILAPAAGAIAAPRVHLRAPAVRPARRPVGRPVSRPVAGAAILQGVSYDAARKALVIPFSGHVPTYELHQLTPTRAYFDIQPAHFLGLYTLHSPGGGEFSRVAMANHPEGGSVRLSFYLQHPGQPEMAWDRARHRLLITVSAATPAPATSPAAVVPGHAPSAAPGVRPSTAPRPSASPRHAATSIKSAYFDSARGLLVLPFSGAVPAYQLSQPEAGELAIDFPGAALGKSGTIRQDLDHHPLLRRWTAQELAGDKPVTRVSLTMAASAEVGVAHDPSLGAMLVIPEPVAESAPLAGPAPRAKTRIATPVFDPRTSELTLTFAGRLPAYNVVRPNATTAYVDLPHAELIAGSMPFERVDLNPLLTFWLLAGRPAIEGQRLILHLPFGGDLKLTPDAANHRLVVKVVAPEPTVPSAAPGTPEPPGPSFMPVPRPSFMPMPGTSRPGAAPSSAPSFNPDAPL